MPLSVSTVWRDYGKSRHDMAQQCIAFRLSGTLVELDDGEFGHPVNGKEHDELALGQPQLAAVDMNEADLGFGETAPFRSFVFAGGQAGSAVPLQAPMQGAAG
jgi:hypothetical protein